MVSELESKVHGNPLTGIIGSALARHAVGCHSCGGLRRLWPSLVNDRFWEHPLGAQMPAGGRFPPFGDVAASERLSAALGSRAPHKGRLSQLSRKESDVCHKARQQPLEEAHDRKHFAF